MNSLLVRLTSLTNEPKRLWRTKEARTTVLARCHTEETGLVSPAFSATKWLRLICKSSKICKELFNKKPAASGGFTLVEAMVATAVMGIGFAGVFSLIALAEQSMQESGMRQKMQMQANQILDIIETDLPNINNYAMGLTNCVAPDPDETAQWVIRGFEWCSRLSGEVGAATVNDTRSIAITTLGDGRRVAHITLESKNGQVGIIMKRTYDD